MPLIRTKGDLLRFVISFVLIKIKVAKHALGLTEEMRAEVASDAVRRIMQTGQWKELNDEVEPANPPVPRLPGPYT